MVRAYSQTSAISKKERDRLIEQHISLAQVIAKRLARSVPNGMVDDLVSAAMVGLVEAANRYDPSIQETFAAFAQKRIWGAVMDELRRRDILPRRVRALLKKAGEYGRRYEAENGRAPEDEVVAAELGVTVDEYQKHLQSALNLSLVELDATEGLIDSVSDQTGEIPSQALERQELREIMVESLKKIPPRDAKILSLYYSSELTYAEIAEVLEVSAPRVCQLHGRALNRLRAEINARTGEDK